MTKYYLVKNIGSQNWQSYKYMIVRDHNDETGRAKGFWFWACYDDLTEAGREVANLHNGLLIETSQVIPVDFNGKPLEKKEETTEDPNGLNRAEKHAVHVMARNLVQNIILEKAFKRDPHIRFGQAVFNISYKMYPKEADALRGTEVDCFYRDDRVEAFLTELDKLLAKFEE